jgi:hypothetical protein
MLVGRRYTGDKSLGFSLFCRCWHGLNVCLGGTHCKS